MKPAVLSERVERKCRRLHGKVRLPDGHGEPFPPADGDALRMIGPEPANAQFPPGHSAEGHSSAPGGGDNERE